TPAHVFSVSGGGTIDTNGLLTSTTVGGPFTVTLSSGGLSATSTVSVTGAAPVFTSQPGADQGQTTTGDTVNFAAGAQSPDGLGLTYTWNWGDGSSATGATSTHTYSQSGSYAVTLTVTDSS